MVVGVQVESGVELDFIGFFDVLVAILYYSQKQSTTDIHIPFPVTASPD